MKKIIKLHLSKTASHILYMGIIEHWSNPHFKDRLSVTDYELLEKLRGILKDYCSEYISISFQELSVLAKAFEIGLKDLDPIDFPTITGRSFIYGQSLLAQINNFILSDGEDTLHLI